MDTLIAQAHCVGLFNQEIEFHLWEDDAKGAGHNAEINKHNKSPKTYKARVNAKGIAEVKISLAAEEKVLREIADRYMMKGDKNEGSHHEYYVTASYSGKVRGASQVNVSVKNPDDKTSNTSTSKPKPESYTPKFPATASSRTPSHKDPQARMSDAYFVNGKNQRLVKTAVGEDVKT